MALPLRETVTRTERASPGKEQKFLTYRSHQRSGSPIGEKSILRLLLNLSKRSYPCLGADSSLLNCDRLYHGKTFLSPFSCPLHDSLNQICYKESHGRSVLPKERTGIPHLPVTPTEWLSHRREGHSPALPKEGTNSVRVTFSRRSPQGRPLYLRNQVQSREKRARNSSRRSHVRSCNFFENTESSGRNLE